MSHHAGYTSTVSGAHMRQRVQCSRLGGEHQAGQDDGGKHDEEDDGVERGEGVCTHRSRPVRCCADGHLLHLQALKPASASHFEVECLDAIQQLTAVQHSNVDGFWHDCLDSLAVAGSG